MSNFWSIFIIVLVVGNILGMVWLLLATNKSSGEDEAKTTGHTWDGIEELNNPLPRWWLGLFLISIIFGVVYLYLYPGLGSYQGSLGWSQDGQYQDAKAKNRAQQAEYFAELKGIDILSLTKNTKAMSTGERLFANNCAACHGSDARGAKGFPNLVDKDWLYGGNPNSIIASITNGRAGVMPNLNLKRLKIDVLARYVKFLSGGEATEYVKTEGKKSFALCASCHGADAKGNIALGAPNLTDNIWLHGASIPEIEQILEYGKTGNMPSFKAVLNEDEIRLLTAYLLSLANAQSGSRPN